MRQNRHRRLRGQATAEFAVGLVVFMSAVIGFIQLGRFGFANIRVAHEARSETDNLLGSGALPSLQPVYRTWNDGTDGLSYTADDQAVVDILDNDYAISQLTVDSLTLEQINPSFYLVNNRMSAAMSLDYTSMHKGEGQETVPIDSTFQRLFFLDDPSVSLRDNATMPPLQFDDFTN